MDIHQLTAFDRIVREGSLCRAARDLHLAYRPSARIQALAQAVVGARLLRSNQGVTIGKLLFIWRAKSTRETELSPVTRVLVCCIRKRPGQIGLLAAT